jgi:hypothetical protein
MNFTGYILIIRITIVSLSGVLPLTTNSQSQFYVISGINKTMFVRFNKNSLVNTSGQYGYMGGFGLEKKIKDHSFSIELNFTYQDFDIKVGPFFFPDDPPTGSGSFYQTNNSVKSVSINPTFNYYLLQGRIFIPIGIGARRTFSSFDSRLIRPIFVSNSETIFYNVPKNNISINTGLGATIYKADKSEFFSLLRYSIDLVPLEPTITELKKIYVSSITLSLGIKFR